MKSRRLQIMITGCLILVFALVTLAAACAKPAPSAPTTVTATTTETATVTKTASVKPITLKFSMWSAPGSAFDKCCMWPLDQIEQRSGGRVTWETYYLGNLIAAAEEIEGVGKGIADTAVLFCPMNRQASLLAGVCTCPGVPTSTGDFVADSHTYANKLWEMGKTSSECQDQFTQKGVKLAWVNGGIPRYILVGKGKPALTCPEDFKGHKVRALGDEGAIVEYFGGAAVGLSSKEEYEGLARGIVDYCVDNPVGAVPWRLEEVTDYWVPCVMGWASYFTIMNLETWNKLPDDIKAIFEEVAEETPDAAMKILADAGEPVAEKKFAEAGVEKLPWPDSEQAKIDQAAAPLAKKWAEQQEANGLPGKAVLNQWAKIWGREPYFK